MSNSAYLVEAHPDGPSLSEISFMAKDGEFHTGCSLLQDLRGKSSYIGVWIPNTRVRETLDQAMDLLRDLR